MERGWSANDTEKSRLIVTSGSALILHVYTAGHIPKICKSVVNWLSVQMINIMCRPHIMYIEPCKPVGHISDLIDRDCGVPIFSDAPCYGPCAHVLAGSDPPPEHPRNWVVMKNLFESLASETRIVFAHADAPVKHWFGKLPPRPASLGGCAILHPGA